MQTLECDSKTVDSLIASDRLNPTESDYHELRAHLILLVSLPLKTGDRHSSSVMIIEDSRAVKCKFSLRSAFQRYGCSEISSPQSDRFEAPPSQQSSSFRSFSSVPIAPNFHRQSSSVASNFHRLLFSLLDNTSVQPQTLVLQPAPKPLSSV